LARPSPTVAWVPFHHVRQAFVQVDSLPEVVTERRREAAGLRGDLERIADRIVQRLPPRGARAVMRCAYQFLRVYWYVAGPETDSAKCVLRHRDSTLLVRHTYGARDLWWLPGGGIRPSEKADAAVFREIREELGAEASELRAIGTLSERKRATTTYHWYAASLDTAELDVNSGENRRSAMVRARPSAGTLRVVPALLGDGNGVVDELLVYR
jgi:ADP-ribose pyrophosphatase YjhB (NUDIX family)